MNWSNNLWETDRVKEQRLHQLILNAQPRKKKQNQRNTQTKPESNTNNNGHMKLTKTHWLFIFICRLLFYFIVNGLKWAVLKNQIESWSRSSINNFYYNDCMGLSASVVYGAYRLFIRCVFFASSFWCVPLLFRRIAFKQQSTILKKIWLGLNLLFGMRCNC